MRFTFDDEALVPSRVFAEQPGEDDGVRVRELDRWDAGYDFGASMSGTAESIRVGEGISVCMASFCVRDHTVLRESYRDVDLYQLGCCLEGSMAWREGEGSECAITAGNIAVQHIGGNDYTSTIPSGQTCRIMSIVVDGAWMRDAVPHEVLCLLDAGPALAPLTAEVDRRIQALIASDDRSWEARLRLRSCAIEAIAIVFGDLSRAPDAARPVGVPADDFRALLQARSIIEQHFAEKITIADLARRVLLNEFKLKRDFKRCFGTTVHAYQRTCRMREARDLLKDEGALVKEVAWRVGYANVSHFIEAYRAEFGTTPTGH